MLGRRTHNGRGGCSGDTRSRLSDRSVLDRRCHCRRWMEQCKVGVIRRIRRFQQISVVGIHTTLNDDIRYGGQPIHLNRMSIKA